MQKKLRQAIRSLEKICLTSDHNPTTLAEIKVNGIEETVKYYNWLRKQAPITAMSLPIF